jgi:hypothetical protein
VVVLALLLAGIAVAGASCNSPGETFGPPGGGPPNNQTGTGPGCIGPTCPDECKQHPVPGCACDVEGQHLLCGKVEATFEDGTNVCGKGVSVCHDGVFGECVINNSVTLVPGAPDGFYTKGLGTGAMCASNPCDPSCVDFVDTTAGLNPDGGVVVKDGGVTLGGDAGGGICQPKTCAQLGKNCGPASDTCGGLLDCGSCSLPATCGGAGVPSQCGVPSGCKNLCLKQVSCPGNKTTSLTGTVYAPNGVTPLPGAVIYVPNGAVAPFTTGVACEKPAACLAGSGSPLVKTVSDVNGGFKLDNVPVGTNIPLVIQVGRFRRQVTIPSITACVNNPVPCADPNSCLSRLPRNKAEGDIPKMAFVTGMVDTLECVWRKIGIDDSEFTPPSGTGRINFYAGAYQPGTYITDYGTTTPWEDALVGNPAQLAKYDIVLFPCQGGQYSWGSGKQVQFEKNIADYVNAGGRVFSTHFSYIWLISDDAATKTCKTTAQACTKNSQCCSGSCKSSKCKAGCYSTLSPCTLNTDCCSGSCVANKCVDYYSPLSPAIKWNINQADPSPDPQNGIINQSFPKGQDLAQWLLVVGASTTLGQMSIHTLRHDFDGVNPPTQLWMSLKDGTPMQATFNTPMGAASDQQCGRVVFSDFHVEDSNNAQYPFPTECSGGPMNAQELLLMDMLFDLASCVTSDTTPPCVPQTCADQGLMCGMAGDGCGGQIDCGTCPMGQTCGGGGTPGVCGTATYYAGADFVRDYDASTICAAGTTPVWRLYSWSGLTPGDSRIEFYVRTADTLAGLASAPQDALQFSNPPGPAGLVGQPAVAHAVNVPPASPDTQLGAASPDATLAAKGRPRDRPFLRVIARLVPTSDKLKSPTLSSWDLQISCAASQ